MFLHFICAFFFFTTSMTPSPLSVSSDGMKEQNQYHFAKAAASPQWCSSRICLFAPDIDHEITAWPSMTILTPVHGVWFHFQYYHLSLIVPSSFTSSTSLYPLCEWWSNATPLFSSFFYTSDFLEILCRDCLCMDHATLVLCTKGLPKIDPSEN